MSDTVAIVLAAGKGMRLGGPKALLMWPGAKGTKPRPLAIVHAETRLRAESTRAIVGGFNVVYSPLAGPRLFAQPKATTTHAMRWNF